MFETESGSVARHQTGVQWHDHGSLVAGTTGGGHHIWLTFVLFVETGVLSCCSDWSRTPKIKQSACLGLSKAGITSMSHCPQPCNFKNATEEQKLEAEA